MHEVECWREWEEKKKKKEIEALNFCFPGEGVSDKTREATGCGMVGDIDMVLSAREWMFLERKIDFKLSKVPESGCDIPF